MTGKTTVTILLGLHNGAEFLGAQLESFDRQTRDDWRLIVSDDGSADDGRERVLDFARARPGRDVTLAEGPRRGFAQNFLHLMRLAGTGAPFAALSDQDDVWLPEKLDRALARIGAEAGQRPALYCGRTAICDARLNRIGLSPLFSRPPGFRNALLQSLGGGNTMVLNRPALDLVQAASREAGEIVAHDWWLYQIVAGAGGCVIYDAEPTVLYRQHGANQIGSNASARARIARLGMVLGGRFRDWNEINVAALSASATRLTAENRDLLDRFAAARAAGPAERLRLLRGLGLYRQTQAGNASFWAAAALGLI